jgi:beta-glucosidase
MLRLEKSMKKHLAQVIARAAILAGSILSGGGALHLAAQDTANLPYLDPKLPAEQRAADLVHRMTLEEKASQMINTARAIPRLKVPAYQWWSEALHGVSDGGVTEFPEPIGLAATFDSPMIHAMADEIGVEARIKHVQDVKAGYTGIGGGLDFWAPNLNLFRDPRWGRGQETYGEDPFLIGRLGVAFVTGMQGSDANHPRVIATPKHFFVHSGPEPTRHFADVDVSRHDQMDTYEPGFRAAIVEGHAGSVMCAYNSINGKPACANEHALQHLLREAWGFQGYVVSDCGAVRDVYSGHHFRPTQAQSTAISVVNGMDNECFNTGFNAGFAVNENDYKPYVEAVQQGYLSESTLDTALVRLFTARMKLGMFDPPETDPYAKIDEKELDSFEHRAMARKVADESMVLLKNDGVLPLQAGTKNILVVGPLADQTEVLLGNYNGQPTRSVSLLDGIRAAFPDAHVSFVPGTQFLRNTGEPIPNDVFSTVDGKPGLKAEYTEHTEHDAENKAAKPFMIRIESRLNLTKEDLPAEAAGKKSVGVSWTGLLEAPETGEYQIGIHANGFAQVSIAGKKVATIFGWGGEETRLGTVSLEKGKKVALDVQYEIARDGRPTAELLWAKVTGSPTPEAIAAAKNADVVIAAVGITSRLEGEEMPVNQPGFLGGDRTSIDLPQPEEDLVEGMTATGKPVVVVLMNGSALAVNWINDHANAVLDAWYSGEEGGNAIADTLSGKNNPAGRLPVTFYTGVEQLPNFEDYSMQNRTYRYFTGKPLYPFGYGLSYTTFGYSNLNLPLTAIDAGEPLHCAVTVTNTGKVAGDEVVELYLTFPNLPGAPLRALRGFQRIHLESGASQKVEFDLKPRDLSMVTGDGEILVPQGRYTVTVGGGQPGTSAPSTTGDFSVKGQLVLPE